MGRHSSAKPRGLRSRSPIVLLSVLLVVALLGWFAVDFLSERLGASSCDTTTELNVTAAEDIAGVVTQVARQGVPAQDGTCFNIRITPRESSAVADSLVLSDGTDRPHVWIPESEIWLQRAQEKGAWNVPVNGTSIASSPVVLALTEDTAGRLGWPGKPLTWASALGPQAPDNLAIGLPDPAREPAGVSALFAVRDMFATAEDPGRAVTSELRSLSPNTVPRAADLFSRLPGADSTDQPLDGFPTSELAVLRHNVSNPDSPLVAAYSDPAIPALDYPFVVLPDAPKAEREAAERFLSALIDQTSTGKFADAGFRTPDGEMLRPRGEDKRTDGGRLTPVPLPEPADVDAVLNQWAGVNLSARIQVLIDVSGSMAEPVPGTGRNRMAVTLQAAELGIGLMKPTTKLGIWLFSTNLDGQGKDYRELFGVKTVAEHKEGGALEQLRAVEALPNGATGLYDSTLAAYKSSTQNYEAGRINIVVVLTDGRNEDANGITREQLLAELDALQDPRRPVQIIGIGIGPDIDEGELSAIAEATGGESFTTPDPTRINEIFYAALSRLLCQPPACQTGAGG